MPFVVLPVYGRHCWARPLHPAAVSAWFCYGISSVQRQHQYLTSLLFTEAYDISLPPLCAIDQLSLPAKFLAVCDTWDLHYHGHIRLIDTCISRSWWWWCLFVAALWQVCGSWIKDHECYCRKAPTWNAYSYIVFLNGKTLTMHFLNV